MNTESNLHKTLSSNESPPGDVTPQSRKRWLKLSTSTVDRAGHILIMDGMDANNFNHKTQFLWQHGSSGALINTIGKVLDLQIANGALFAHVEYDTSPLGEQIFELDAKGLLPANSIGFRPIEWHANDFGGN